MRIISKRLNELRRYNGFTQAEVAKGIDRTQASVSRWESGARIPDAEALAQICKFYRVSADYLLGFIDEWGDPMPGMPELDHSAFGSEPIKPDK